MKSEADIWYSIDFETSSPNKYSCLIDRVCVGRIDDTPGQQGPAIRQGWRYWDFRNEVREGQMFFFDDPQLRKMMSTPHPKIFHNASFDLHLMEKRLGIPVKGTVHDTYLMAKHFRNDLPAYDLKSLSYYMFGDLYKPLTELREWIHKHDMKGEDDIDFDMTKCPDRLVHNYCMHDVEMTAKLACWLYPKVMENYAYQQDTELIRSNERMESNGITVDVPYLKRVIRLGGRRIKRNTKQAATLLEVSKGRKPTGKALRNHLENRGEGRRTPTGMCKADDAILRDHALSPAVRAVQRIRHDQKIVNTYANNILSVVNEKGIFHPNLVQSAAITRRYRSWSMYGDNGVIAKGQVQNIIGGPVIRTGFIVPDGFGFVKLDLASIEARIGAHAMSVFLGEDWFAEQYRKDDNFNIYIYVAEDCTDYKGINKKQDVYTAYKHGCLGVQYGVGIKTFHKTMVDKFQLPYTYSGCEHVYKTIRRNFPQFSALQRFGSGVIRKEGCIYDDFGAVYYLPLDLSYKGVNYYCQGCAGNVFKWWMLETDKLMKGTEDYRFNVVHDEQNLAVKRDRQARGRVKSYCDCLKKLDIFELPIIAETRGLRKNWADC